MFELDSTGRPRRGSCLHAGDVPVLRRSPDEAPPARSGKCPSCLEHIAYVRGADDLVYLARDADADAVRAEVDAHWAMSQDYTGGKRNANELRGYSRLFRARYAALGVQVWTRHGDESCANCGALQRGLIATAERSRSPAAGLPENVLSVSLRPCARE